MDMSFNRESFGKHNDLSQEAFCKLLTRYVDRTGFQYASIPLVQKAVYSLKKAIAHQR